MRFNIDDPQKCEIFVSLFQHIKQFTEFVNIIFQTERMYLQCMDNASVIIVEMILPSSWFTEYVIEASETIGINASMLSKVLNTRDKSQRIVWHNELTDKLSVQFMNPEDAGKNVFNKFFEIPLLDIDCELMDIPEMEHQVDLVMSSVTFANVVNQLRVFGETFQIVCTEDKISMEANSIEVGKMSVDVSIDDIDEFAIEEGAELSLGFSLKYLHDISLYQKITKSISIGLSDNTPMRSTYHLQDDAVMNFYLAPKIQDD